MDPNDILYGYQFGFRKQAIITLVNKIISCLDNGDLVIGVFLDLNTQMSHILNIVPIGTIKIHFFIIIITPIERSLGGHKFLYY